jgi:hypothetical protein
MVRKPVDEAQSRAVCSQFFTDIHQFFTARFGFRTKTERCGSNRVLPFVTSLREMKLVVGMVLSMWALAGGAQAAGYRDRVEPILVNYCFDCHGDGATKGDVSLDFADETAAVREVTLWDRVWHNLETHLMPPAEKDQPNSAEREELVKWIERDVFKIDPKNPDPGRVTIRRLNREEYRYSVRDLLGVDFSVDDNFPPDDTGYGFDTIGDVLSLSPLLLEKYMSAAQEIVSEALPLEAGRIPQRVIKNEEFMAEKGSKTTAGYLPFNKPNRVRVSRWVPATGDFKVDLRFKVTGSIEATENTALLRVKVGDQVVSENEIGWDSSERIVLSGRTRLEKGNRDFSIELIPANPPKEGEKPLVARVDSVRFEGPLDGSVKEYSNEYKRIMVDGPPPSWEDQAGRRAYARKILGNLAERAFRRPIDDLTLEKLVSIALTTDNQPDTSFEEGIRQAVAGILVSPRFLFRSETQPQPDDPDRMVPLDDFALASRLSYFLWRSLPDATLLEEARKGTLRRNLTREVDRMLKDPRSERFVVSFVGQWLQARDVTTINLNARAILKSKDLEEALKYFSHDLRRDMQRESEMLFAHVLRENRPVTELLTADYAFLSEKLAQFYGIDGVEGREMRKVALQGQRGGVLRQATFLMVTSNPTRTSPVKRGLFVLENLLGAPAPPPPPNIPALEAAKKPGLKNPTVRELMELHRQEALCASCHARMDPLGLAFENYNALGQWRESENGKPIETSGKLITGETFQTADDLVKILATSRKRDVHRAMVEKVMIYALGRGLEYYDRPELERMVTAIESKNATLRAVIDEVIASTAFQNRRGDGNRLVRQ